MSSYTLLFLYTCIRNGNVVSEEQMIMNTSTSNQNVFKKNEIDTLYLYFKD